VPTQRVRGRWVRYSGMIDGKPASSRSSMPDDFRFPQPMRIFPDSPSSATPRQLGEFQIVPGKPFVQRYRFIVADGSSALTS